jgi:hypothetical protein
VKYWEIIADNLKKAGWSLGYASAVDCEWRTFWIVDAHRERTRFCRQKKRFTGVLKSWGTLLPITIEDGKILN